MQIGDIELVETEFIKPPPEKSNAILQRSLYAQDIILEVLSDYVDFEDGQLTPETHLVKDLAFEL